MGVIRVVKTDNYTIMSNHHLRDKNLTLKAKGLMSLMLSLPNEWDYSVAGLVAIVREGETAVRSAISELEKYHYLIRERVYVNGKIADWNYTLYEMPTEFGLPVENLQVENLVQENLVQDFTAQINTEELNTEENKILNNKSAGAGALSKTSSRRNFRKEHEQLTDELASGKVIDEEKKEKKKKTNYEKCLDELSSRNFSDDVKQLLVRHLDWSYNSKDPKRIKDRSSYKSKLDFLEQRQKQGDDLIKIIQQSLDRGWHAFYEYKGETVSNNSYEPLADRVVMNNPEEARKVLEQLRANPNKKVY